MSTEHFKKPAIVFVPGAWHKPEAYAGLLGPLKADGYEVHSKQLPSVGATDGRSITIMTDVEFVRENLLFPLLDAGKDVIVISHSYGGFVGGGTTSGLGKGESKRPGSVVGFVVIAGIPQKAGVTFVTGQPEPADWIGFDEATGNSSVTRPVEILYQLSPTEKAEAAVKLIQTHAISTFGTELKYESFTTSAFEGKRLYVYCLQDKAIPIDYQREIVQRTGVEWITKELDTDHSPFLSQPQELFDAITGVIKNW